ncbi:hypothetical protein ABZP36_023324 [Zizania latifolia]
MRATTPTGCDTVQCALRGGVGAGEAELPHNLSAMPTMMVAADLSVRNTITRVVYGDERLEHELDQIDRISI